CADQDLNGLPDPVVEAWSTQLLDGYRQSCYCDAVGIQRIGFAHTVVVFGVHTWRFGHRVAVGGHGAGQDGTVGGGPFDDPQGVSIGFSAPSYPGHGAVDAGCGGGKIVGINHHTGGGGEDGVDVFAGVSVNTHDKRMCISDNSHSGRCLSNVMEMDKWPSNGRYHSGRTFTSEQHCDGSRHHEWRTIFSLSHPRWAGRYRPPTCDGQVSYKAPHKEPAGRRVTSTDGTASTNPASRSQTSYLKSHSGESLFPVDWPAINRQPHGAGLRFLARVAECVCVTL